MERVVHTPRKVDGGGGERGAAKREHMGERKEGVLKGTAGTPHLVVVGSCRRATSTDLCNRLILDFGGAITVD